MKLGVASLCVLAAIAALRSPATAATAEPTSSAMQWLGLVDSQKYAQSWAEGSFLFRARVTERSWESTTGIFREAVGHIVYRDPEGVSLAGELPNYPKGQYAVVHYRSDFQNATGCLETVSLTLENGLWRVVTYTITKGPDTKPHAG